MFHSSRIGELVNKSDQIVKCSHRLCTENAAEDHHSAPRSIFGKDADNWPLIPLCKQHHAVWHVKTGVAAGYYTGHPNHTKTLLDGNEWRRALPKDAIVVIPSRLPWDNLMSEERQLLMKIVTMEVTA